MIFEFLLDETRHTDPLSEQIVRIRRSSKRRRALRESKVGHARPLASQDSAAKRRLRIGKIMDNKRIFRQNRSAAEKDCLWQPEG